MLSSDDSDTGSEDMDTGSDETDDVLTDGRQETSIGGKKNGGKAKDKEGIETIQLTEFSGALDENSGNVAFIIINYPSEKKPISDRRSYNWGTSHTYRGSTMFYPCAGYSICVKCNEGSTDDGNCHSCNVKLKQRICPAKKYIYFCKNTCLRKFYKGCCGTPNKGKLVFLWIKLRRRIPARSKK